MLLAFTLFGALILVAALLWALDYITIGQFGPHWPTEPKPKPHNQAANTEQPNVEQYRPTCSCGKSKKGPSR
jgi:hypothetical protein